MERVLRALQRIYGDTSVDLETTAARVKAIRLECEELLTMLGQDGVDVASVQPAERPDVL